MQYTPGPWVVCDEDDTDYCLVGPHDGDGLVYNPVVKLHGEANARLIAASPEMLNALVAAETVLRYLPDMATNWSGQRSAMTTRQAETLVKAAIIKAVGN